MKLAVRATFGSLIKRLKNQDFIGVFAVPVARQREYSMKFFQNSGVWLKVLIELLIVELC